jgi:hypothetical protein
VLQQTRWGLGARGGPEKLLDTCKIHNVIRAHAFFPPVCFYGVEAPFLSRESKASSRSLCPDHLLPYAYANDLKFRGVRSSTSPQHRVMMRRFRNARFPIPVLSTRRPRAPRLPSLTKCFTRIFISKPTSLIAPFTVVSVASRVKV